MKKRIFPRLALALFVSLTAFVLLSAMQFARYGTFSKQVGAMTISGRYFNGQASEAGASRPGWIRLDGGASVSFGGLEFRLAYTPGTDGGFSIVDAGNVRIQVIPEYISISGNEAVFSLPSGVVLSFASQIPEGADGLPLDVTPELRISGMFPEGISAIDIPFRSRRSSIAWDNARGILGITYEGIRYKFSRHSQGLTEGRLALLASTPTVFYRVMPDVIVNDPADFVIPGMESPQFFSREFASWTDRNFDLWGRNMPPNVGEDRVIALSAEALRRGTYGAAVSLIPAAFSQSPNRTWESSVFQFDRRAGVWEQEVGLVGAQEREKIGLVGELLARRDYGTLFAKNRLIEFLAVRGHNSLIDSYISSVWALDPHMVTLETSAGVLESYMDMSRRRAGADNPFEPLAARARQIVADGLRQNGYQVFVFSPNGQADIKLNMRLGKVLIEWGERVGDDDWASLGRSLLLSVMSLADGTESVPAFLTSSVNGNLTASTERLDTASLFRIFDENEFLPRAKTTGVSGVWAWSAARSVNVTQTANFMDIYVDFPVGQAHYVMLRNVRPFVQLQMHGQNTPRNPLFEDSYGVSGWYYFADEQALLLKIQHRTNVERVRVLFTVPPPAPTPAPPPPPPPPPVQQVAPPVVEPSPEMQPPPIRARPPTWAPPPVAPFFMQGGQP